METTTHSFRAETQKLLDIVIHSLYSNKEIFLRELISNASDALDRLRLEALTTPDLHASGEILEIRLEADPTARTLSISDNGIGMSRDEVVENLGTIAKSGTREVLRAARAGAAKRRRARTPAPSYRPVRRRLLLRLHGRRPGHGGDAPRRRGQGHALGVDRRRQLRDRRRQPRSSAAPPSRST